MKRLLVWLIFFAPITLWAQTGPGGIGNKDGESQQPKTILWLNVENLSLGDGADVTSWPDASGNSNNLSASASLSPFFQNSSPVNGFGYTFFDQTTRPNSRMFRTNFGEIASQENSIAFVIRTTDQDDAWLSYATVDDNEMILLKNSNDLEATYTNNNSTSPGVDVNDGSWRIVVISSTASNGFVDFKVDGGEIPGLVTSGFEIDPGGTLWLGHQQTTPNSGPVTGAGFEGDIAEVIAYGEYLTNIRRRILTNYLSAKFDIAISNDIYAGDDNVNGDYDYDVAGIGRSLGASHLVATSAGLTLDDAPGDISTDGEYLMFGHNGASATVDTSPSDVQTGVEQRWNRDWYIDKTTPGSLGTRISFDLEAVGGLFPQVADDYVLLHWTGAQYDTVTVGIANKRISGSQIQFTVADADLVDGRYTLGTTDGTNSPVAGLGNKTWYAYQSGSWTDWQVWTLDGAEAPLLVNPNQEKPGATDNVIVGSGKTVNVDSTSFDLKSMKIVGTLDLQDQTGHNFNSISGSGILRLSGNGGLANFPAGDYEAFANGESGGTVEAYGTGFDISEDIIFNNARVLLDNSTDIIEVVGDSRFNGSVEVTQGILRINDNSSSTNLKIDILGDLIIAANGTLEVGTANARHQMDLYGDFNNNGGTAKFTNRVATDYNSEATDGIIDLNLLNTSADQNLQVNGTTNFYRIEIDKQNITNIVTAIASDPSFFNLFGPANYDHDTGVDQLVDNSSLPINRRNLNALGLYRGTFNIGPNIDIPVLSTGASTNYLISRDASLIVAGGTLNKDNGTSITSYGNLSVVAGTLSILADEGLILKDQALFRSLGGTSTMNQFTTRTGLGAAFEQGQSLFQTGGDITINGNGGNTSYKNLQFTHETNVIILSGGTLTVNGGDQAASRGVLINSSSDRVTASGGNVFFVLDQAGIFEISSTAELWNVNLKDTDGTGGNEFELQTSFGVNANITLENTPNNAVLDGNGNDLLIGRGLFIEDGAIYTTAGNNTIFNGSENGQLFMGVTSTQNFDGLDIAKDDAQATVTINNGNGTVAVQVDDELRIESGNLNYNTFNIEAKAGIYVADSLGTDGATGRLVINGTTDQAITSSSGTLFNIELDNNNGTDNLGLTLTGNMSIAGTLTMTNGVFDLNSAKLTIDGSNGSIVDGSGSGFDNTRMIMTAGQFGDGGLEHYVDANETILFPIGTDADTDGDITAANEQRYTEATAVVTSYSDDGYIRFIPADGVLATSKDPARTLSFSWRVKPSGFTSLPTVEYTLIYDDEDEPSGWTPPQPAKVVSGNRCQEVAGNINATTNTITFNGDIDGGTCTDTGGAGFTLESGQYTAAKNNAFTGQLETFYSWTTNDDVLEWEDQSHWSLDPATYVAPTGSPKWPDAGDIAIIQSDGVNWHRIATHDGLEVAGLFFDNSNPAPGGQLPQLDILSNNSVILNEVSGEGHIRIRVNPNGGADILPTFSADIDGVLTVANSIIEYNATNEAVVGITPPTVAATGTVVDLLTTIIEYPNLYIGADAEFDAGGFIGEYPMRFTEDITASTLTIYNGGYLQTNAGSNGDIEVTGNMEIGDGTDETILEYNGDGNARTVTVYGNLGISTNAEINVESGTTDLEHFLRVAQDVNKDNTRFFISKNATDRAFLTWEFFGSGNHSFDNSVMDQVSFARILMNKGVDTTSTFTINTDFNLTGDNTDAAKQVLELQNGLLNVNNSSIDVLLSNSGGEIEIPSSSGLDLQAGTLRTEGNSGFRLDGLLRISGGTIDTRNGNAASTGYIRSSNTGSAQFEISAGILNLAGSFRRDIESNTMQVIYKQTGGTVNIALNSAGVLTTKGVFEVLGTNSSFTYTGGDLILVHSNGSQLIPSLSITPGAYNVSRDIQLGSVNTIDDGFQQSFGLNSTITINGLILNSDGLDPDALLLSSTFDMDGSLQLASGTIFDANDNTLIIGGDMTDNGQFLAKSGVTVFSSDAAQQINGSSATSFYDLVKEGSGTLTLTKAITINDDLSIDAGELYDDGFTVLLLGNLTVVGDHRSNGGEGIKMQGASRQLLTGESLGVSKIGVLTVNNTLGIEVPANGYDFLIDDELRLSAGVLDIGGSLLILDTNASIEEVNPFGLNNMIRTNNSFTDNGVQKNFPVNWSADLTFPIGESEYNPVSFDFGSAGSTSGTTAGSLLVRPAAEPHPSVTGTDTSPTNRDNVLQFYWVLDGTTLTDFSATMTFQYNDNQVSTDDPLYDETDYIGARYLSDNNPTNSVNKLGDIVDEVNNLIQLTVSGVDDDGISGDYFAGVDPAIQSTVAEYTTIASGNVDGAIYTPAVPGGGAPVGAIVNIDNTHTVTFQINDVNFYATDIRAGGEILVIETFNHRLGDVTGTGTLNLQSSVTNVVLPAAQYDEFFSATGGTLEYSGTGSYNILGGIPAVRFLTLSGSGDRTMGSTPLTVYEDFNITGGDFTNPNNLNIVVNGNMTASGGTYLNGTSSNINIGGNLLVNGGSFDGNSGGIKQIVGNLDVSSGSFSVGTGGFVRIGGDLTYSGGSINTGTNQSVLAFNGSSGAQSITGAFTGGDAFNNITINNSLGVSIANDIDIAGELSLTDGLLVPGVNTLLITSTGSALPTIGTSTSYVNGKLSKELATGEGFIFPIGNASRRMIGSVNDVTAGPGTWTMEFIQGSATGDLDVSVDDFAFETPLVTLDTGMYWKVNSNGLSADATIGMSWDENTDVSPVREEREDLNVAWYDNVTTNNWIARGGTNFSTGHSQASGYFEATTATSFSIQLFALASTDVNNALPIELVYFKGRRNQNGVLLNWQTASELNNDYFEIETASDGENFKPVARIQGAGNSLQKLTYEWLHSSPIVGLNYYRLKQVDFDGSFAYSDVISVINDTPVKLYFSLYPQPATQSVTFDITSSNDRDPIQLAILGADGKVATSVELSPDQRIFKLNLSGYRAGIYLVRLVQSSEVFTGKLLIQH